MRLIRADTSAFRDCVGIGDHDIVSGKIETLDDLRAQNGCVAKPPPRAGDVLH